MSLSGYQTIKIKLSNVVVFFIHIKTNIIKMIESMKRDEEEEEKKKEIVEFSERDFFSLICQ